MMKDHWKKLIKRNIIQYLWELYIPANEKLVTMALEDELGIMVIESEI